MDQLQMENREKEAVFSRGMTLEQYMQGISFGNQGNEGSLAEYH